MQNAVRVIRLSAATQHTMLAFSTSAPSSSPLRSSPYLRTLLILAAFLLTATVLRLGLYLYYPEDFQTLSASQVLVALAVGWRFDISMAIVMAGLPLVFLMLPFGWSHHRYWQRLWLWCIYALLVVFAFMTAADLVYFGYVHRHTGSEINMAFVDIASTVGFVVRQYALALLVFAASVLALGALWARVFAALPRQPRRPWARLVALPFVFFGMLVVARGGIGGKPLSVGEAFFSDTPAQGYLAMNGAFAISRALMESPPAPRSWMPEAQATALVQQQLAGDTAAFTMPGYPLLRSFQPPKHTPQPNVVVLMLESWGAQHIDALRRLKGQQPLGATPNFDALAKNGRLYTRFYANGQRSIQGAAAVLASQPTLPGMPFLGEGLEQNRISFMGEIARAQGYQTYFLQSSEQGSLRLDAIATRAGFSTYKGSEEIPNLHEQAKPTATWGTWDHNTFQEAHRLFAASAQPFLGFVFTSSTHAPWIIPDARFQKFQEPTPKGAFLNSLVYADWALGELIAAAKKAGYFDNTIFVLLADHADSFVEHPEDIPNLYHIPLLITGPGIAAGIDDRIGSQFDILPTLMDLGSWQGSYAGLGRSLLTHTAEQNRASFGVRGDAFDWISKPGWISHNLDKRLGQSPGLAEADAAQMQQNFLASYQVFSTLQRTNGFKPTP